MKKVIKDKRTIPPAIPTTPLITEVKMAMTPNTLVKKIIFSPQFNLVLIGSLIKEKIFAIIENQ
ncbi:MAG: hypothetical protein CME60_12830 [Halobacteriovoraceae bacterium]|nr:hypothetical protein [Halobacteriovoraceae bacterium]